MELTKPTYEQAQDAYQFLMEKVRQHPEDELTYRAFLHAERLLNILWDERQEAL